MSETNSGNEMPGSAVKSRTRQVFLVVGVLVPLAAISVLWWQHAHPSLDRYAAALEAMRTHHVSCDDSGRVDFSKQFPGLVPYDDLGQDYALVSWLDDGSFRAVFPTYHGKGAELAGLLYTSRPLQEEDTTARVSAIHFDQRTIRVGSYTTLLLEQRLNDHWYKVSYRLH